MKRANLAILLSMSMILPSLAAPNNAGHGMDHSNMGHSNMDHAQMGHGKMNHANTHSTATQDHSMHNMTDMQSMMQNKMQPAEFFNLPKNQPLQALPLVKNLSQESGEFKAELNPMLTEVALTEQVKPTFWLYNGMMLPVIDVNLGDKIDITVNNQLTEPTTIHWHGLSVPPSQDGNPHDPILSQQTGRYQFDITSDMSGSHWFHPHTHLLTGKQVAQGLAGLFIVRDPNDPLQHLPEQNLFFSDLKLDETGQIAPNDMLDLMNGREGQFALINGQWQPEVTLSGTERWRLWNGNSARYLNFDFPEDSVEVFLVATDGGLIEKPIKLSSLLLTPGERAEIVISSKDLKPFNLISKAYDRDKMGPVAKEEDIILASVRVVDGKKIDLPSNLAKLTALGEPVVTRQLIYTEEMMPMRFLINGKSHDMNRIDFTAKKGDVELWEVTNNSHMDHNFHLHGPQFQVVEFERNGVITKPDYLLYKDTINIRPGETLRILTQQNHLGIRMYHCHVLEHEDAGMMGQLEVL
ncbi:multicopper oxidase family protein [Thorsellia anophelis]|uniref:Bilirubin oxidase n=1 Tax=Thorsellia anophelis DSM 18579 TaxID=1123402 RepID=A0A1I0B5X4_9GAMM|nr:multicopper oxidase family protein [Thorsellia anophelis]SET01542.1 bilirubin oxidase [Thorsellia anophelis DSM 18579]